MVRTDVTVAQRIVERLAGDALRHVDVHDPRTYARVLREGHVGAHHCCCSVRRRFGCGTNGTPRSQSRAACA